MEFARVFVVLVYIWVSCSSAARIRRRWAVDDDGCRTPDRGVGICKKITDCAVMINFIESKGTLTNKEQHAVRSYQCGVDGNLVKVCCPNKTISLEWIVPDDDCRAPDGSQGTCISIADCRIIREFIQGSNIISEEDKEKLRRYACGYDNTGQVKVCCPSQAPSFLVLNRLADHSTHTNYKLLSTSCGQAGTTEKITNGNITNLYEFPWATALKYDKKVNPYSCGGSLINDRYVLTAAHCIRSQNKLIGVRLGEHDFNTDPDCDTRGPEKVCAEPVQDFEVSIDDAVVHPEYNADTIENDIALLRLRRPANTTVYSVSPVCLPITTAEKARQFTNYTVIGWGATETGYSSPVLLKIQVPKVSTSSCASIYKGQTKVTDKQLCAGGKKEQDSCAGDSGGPLMAEYTEDGMFKTIQYGIVSYGLKICGRIGYPAVYTSIDKYMTWILDTLRE